MNNAVVGYRLKTMRKNSNLNQQKVADLLGIKRASYANLENGHRSISHDLARRIAEIFQILPSELFREETSEEENEALQSLEEHYKSNKSYGQDVALTGYRLQIQPEFVALLHHLKNNIIIMEDECHLHRPHKTFPVTFEDVQQFEKNVFDFIDYQVFLLDKKSQTTDNNDTIL